MRRQKRHKKYNPPHKIPTIIFIKTIAISARRPKPKPKKKPKKQPPNKKQKVKPNLKTLFPERTAQISLKNNKIGFRFAGCRPVAVKPKNKFSSNTEIIQNEEFLKRFNKKVVLCGRKLLKPIYLNTYGNRFQPVSDLRSITL